MTLFDECCVLIPSSTLEDFPADLSDYDARSLLAGWTVLWHPQLLASCEQIPAWYRADAPPSPPGRRAVVVPSASRDQVPEHYEQQVRDEEGACWITGSGRAEMLEVLQLDSCGGPLSGPARLVGVEDFFALGYAVLQIQVMTRRLRYTSNLDEVHLQTRAVAAAQAFLAGDAAGAIEALHDAFDALAEERDHYFASDPHLIDLTLLTGSTLDRLLDSDRLTAPEAAENASAKNGSADSKSAGAGGSAGASLGGSETQGEGQPAGEDTPARLPTPWNVLIDAEVAGAVAQLPGGRGERLRAALAAGRVGWAGGGPAGEVCLETLTFTDAESALRAALEATTEAIGTAPSVYARFGGSTPSDLNAALVRLGYEGLIPIDFLHGTGYGDEAKVIHQVGGVEIEALTAKPIDAASDGSFLTLAARMGEAIDSGEIATALLAHWPGTACDSFSDLRRVGSWSLSLGKFWKLDDYFRDGEHPYHHGPAQPISPDAASRFAERVAAGAANPLSTVAESFRQAVRREQEEICRAMAFLISGKPTPAEGDAGEILAAALGAAPQPQPSGAALLINPQSVACRQSVRIQGRPPAKAEHIYAASSEGHQALVTADVPACGFSVVQAGQQTARRNWLAQKLFAREKPIAEATFLRNEFMEVTLDSKSGGVNGVYSGATRGNRFSLRLVHCDPTAGSAQESAMECQQLRVTESTPDAGTVEASGVIRDAEGNARAHFTIRYTLRRGSRFLETSGQLQLTGSLASDPWKNYVGARVAVASEAAIEQALVRDKLHRARGRRLVAPLGLVIDEAERQTLVASAGLAYHRRVGDRFLDTLLAVRGETELSWRIDYGFDVPNPVGAAKSRIAPPRVVPIAEADRVAPRGWIVHSGPKGVLLTGLRVRRRSDGKLAAIVRLMQTRGSSGSASLRFCRDVAFARALGFARAFEGSGDERFELPADEDAAALQCQGDRVQLPLAGHAAADVLVVFAGE